MGSIVVTEGQSLADVCLQELGTVDALFDLADANNLSISDALSPGQQLQVPAAVIARPEIAAYFARRRQRINTGNDMQLATAPPPPPPSTSGIFDLTFPKPPFN